MAGISWNGCNDWKWLEMAEMARMEMTGNGWKWLDLAGMAGIGWTWLDMAGMTGIC